jgi:acyl-activating enzyme 14
VGASVLLFDAAGAHVWHALRGRAGGDQEGSPLRAGALLASPPADDTSAAASSATPAPPPRGAECVEALIAAAASAASAAPLPLPLRRAPGDVVTLVFTSGTTGTPKAAALTHASFAAASAAKLAVVGYAESDVYLHSAPLCHVGGLSSAHALLCARGAHLFLPRWSATGALSAMRAPSRPVTATALVPAMLSDLLAAADADADAPPLESMRRVLLGGGAAPPALLAAAAQRLFPHAAITATYALSEAGSTVAFRRVATDGVLHPPPVRDSGGGASSEGAFGTCVGAAAPGVELAVATWPSGAIASPGASGELLARGAQLMAGYWRDVAASEGASMVLPHTGAAPWLRTGDIGTLDASGRVWLAGRAKDVIKSGGESVHASEVEAALCTHPDVAAAAAVGLPHARWGETVAALVLLRPGATWRGPTAGDSVRGGGDEAAAGADVGSGTRTDTAPPPLTPDALREHACGVDAGGLSRFKAPRFVAAWRGGGGALPAGPGGKVCKRSVRDALLAAQADAEAHAQGAQAPPRRRPALAREPLRSRL